MKIVTVATHKGGSGKTTLCRHLAVAAWQAGVATIIVDTDPQGGVRDWGARRDKDPFVLAEQSAKPAHLEDTLKRCRQGGAELVIVDTAGHFNAIAAVAAKLSDLTLVPVRPTPDDLEALWPTVSDLQDRKVKLCAVISQVPTTTPRPLADARHLLAENGVPFAPAVIHQRSIVPLSGVSGETVLELGRLRDYERGAAEEFRALWTWLAGELDLPVKGQEGNEVVEQAGNVSPIAA